MQTWGDCSIQRYGRILAWYGLRDETPHHEEQGDLQVALCRDGGDYSIQRYGRILAWYGRRGDTPDHEEKGDLQVASCRHAETIQFRAMGESEHRMV